MSTTSISNPPFENTFKHHIAEVNGIQLHYVLGGKGSAMLLIHGYPETWYAWRKIMPALSKHYTVIAVDLRGFGDSSKPASGYDSRTMAEDVHQLMQQLHFSSYYLVAHDMGGPSAYVLAAKYPNEVLKFACLDTAAPESYWPLMDITHGGKWHFGFFMTPVFPEMLTKGKEKEFLNAFAYQGDLVFIKDAMDEQDISEYLRSYGTEDGMRPGFACYRSLPEDVSQNINDFGHTKSSVPVLAIGGEKGFSDWAYRAMKQVAYHVEKAIIPNCGHFIAEEQPEALIEILSNFFKEEATISTGNPCITFIQCWKFKNQHHQGEWLETMKQNIHLLRSKPGFVSMTLYPSIDGLELIVYAQWENEELLNAAVADPKAVAGHKAMVTWSTGEPVGQVFQVESVVGTLTKSST